MPKYITDDLEISSSSEENYCENNSDEENYSEK